MQKALFLDRDGTIIVEEVYLHDPQKVAILAGVAFGLKKFQEAGYLLIVISNQSGVGRGYFTHAEVDAVNRKMCTLLAEEGVKIDGIYYCPHTPEELCNCRKPNTGLIDAACRDFSIDIPQSIMVGDKLLDVELAEQKNMQGVLVLTGYGKEEQEKRKDITVCASLDELAAKIIL